MVALKALRLLEELELAAVPPLLCQLLVLSTQEGVRLVVLKGLLARGALRLRIEARRSENGGGNNSSSGHSQ